MILDYSVKGELRVDMTHHVKDMIETFPEKLTEEDIAKTPAGNDLFTESKGPQLEDERREVLHKISAKGLFVCKRARLDIHPTISVLCTRVKQPRESDWNKLKRMIKYLNGTKDMIRRISADTLKVIKWYVDASFAVHPDFKSHTGSVMKFGNGIGAVEGLSAKQKLNTKSSTEAELVGVDDTSVLIMWTVLFLHEQGYDVEKNILYQDKKSAILLEKNGKSSSGKRTRALNIRYFFMTDQIEKKNVRVAYCPTDEMVGDYMTKPLQGAKFIQFRKEVMGL